MSRHSVWPPGPAAPGALAVLLAGLLMAGCSSSAKPNSDAPGVAVEVFAARRAPIAREIRAEAVLYPLHEVVVVPKISAPVAHFLVNRGDRVRRGQLLAVLDNADLQAVEVRDYGLYRQALAQYREATASALPLQLQQARGAVAMGNQQYEAARQLYLSSKSLYAQGALSGNQLEQSRVQYIQAVTQRNQARWNLQKLLGVGRQAQLEGAAGQLAAAKGTWQAAEAQLDYSEIRSPINGVVTSRPLFPGQMATTSTPLMTLMDLHNVIARAPLPPGQAQWLRVGQPAAIRVGTIRAPGKVTVVSPALDVNSTTVQVWLEAVNPGLRLRPGDTAQVTIIASRPRPALVIPRSAVLTSSAGATAVMVVGPRLHARRMPVRLGIRQGNWIEVIGGLRPGERVISQGAYGLPNGTPVRIEPPA